MGGYSEKIKKEKYEKRGKRRGGKESYRMRKKGGRKESDARWRRKRFGRGRRKGKRGKESNRIRKRGRRRESDRKNKWKN